MPTMSTPSGASTQNATLKAYEDKVQAQLQEAKAKLDQLEAGAKEHRAEAEIKALSYLKTSKQNIDQKLHDLRTTHDAHVSRAKADIDAHVTSFKASIAEIAAKFKAQPAKK
jgi:F0F1-type ATP synthase membrane subunit b/b'